MVLQEIERARNRAFVRGDDGCAELFAAGSPQHRDALWWREGQPEAGDDVVVVGRVTPPEPMSVAGIGAVTDEALEAERVDLGAGEPHCLCSAAEVAAGVLRGARRAELLIVASAPLRPASSVERDLDGGILRQLRSALSIAPVGPPASLALGLDPRGLFGQSGHRAEVCAAA